MGCKKCLRCRKSNLGICTLGFNKTESQLKEEQYKCFDERIYNIDAILRHPDYEYIPYLNEINYANKKLHSDMGKSERNLRVN